MKVSGFTIIRNAVKFDYPVVESITSILPCVDEMVVALGNSEDETRALIEGIGSPKIRIIDTVWDDSLREGGRVLAEETNKALSAISPDSDWAFYIQADEVLHEDFIPIVRQAMEALKDRKEVEGLLFHYTHFYGNYHYTGASRNWYRHEIRVVRPQAGLRSYKDAQGFRVNDRKLNVIEIPAWIYHYGWVKNPVFQQEKQKHFHKLWHSDDWVEKHVQQADSFDYQTIDALDVFTGRHPQVMKERIARLDWDFSWDIRKKKFNLKKRLLHWFEAQTGYRLFEYRNYRKIGRFRP